MAYGDLISLLLCLILAAGLGILSQRILGFKMGGLFVSIFIGFVGALLGRELYRWFQLPEYLKLDIGNQRFPVTWCVIGALISTLIVGAIAKSSKGDKRK